MHLSYYPLKFECAVMMHEQSARTYYPELMFPFSATRARIVRLGRSGAFDPLTLSATQACAANSGDTCTYKIPIIHKTVTMKLLPCPIKAGVYAKSTTFTLPAKDPSPLSVTAKGTVTLLNGDGSTVVKLEVDADISPKGSDFKLADDPTQHYFFNFN
jgi:hypothetical protein